MFQVLKRASLLLAVAPASPVSWWPGAQALPESVLRRLPNGGYRGVMTTLRPSGARVIAVPVEDGPVVPMPDAATATPPSSMHAPWGEPPVPFAGVTVATCQVPRAWIRPVTVPIAAVALPGVVAPTPRATITQLPRQPRAWPPVQSVISRPGPHSRFRRAATLALGLLVSLVAVEAANRSTRR